MHVGDHDDWASMTCGDLILSKRERQAEEFARLYPDWGEYEGIGICGD